MPSSKPRVSVIVVSLNEGDWLKSTVDSILPTLDKTAELIVVDDMSSDGSSEFLSYGYQQVITIRPEERVGAARARNLGAAHATGDVLVFSDAHVEVPNDWCRPLVSVLERPEVAAVGPGISVLEPVPVRPTGYGQTWRDASLDIGWLYSKNPEPHAVPLLGGGFIALRADVFRTSGGFDSGIKIWGSEDSELCVRLWSLGYECVVVPSVIVAHKFRTTRPYTVSWEEIIYNKLRMAALHFGPERIQQVDEFYKPMPEYPAASVRLAKSDVELRRTELEAMRVRDDAWFFSRFGCDFTPNKKQAAASVA